MAENYKINGRYYDEESLVFWLDQANNMNREVAAIQALLKDYGVPTGGVSMLDDIETVIRSAGHEKA